MNPILELRDITKVFGAKAANDRISLSVHPGSVHALVGENGAGKSTLMSIASGNAQPDEGEIAVGGALVTLSDPKKAMDLGIGMVHQHFKLVPSLTVAANVYLGRELRTQFGTLDRAGMDKRVHELSERFGLPIDPQARIADLSVGVRQRVELIKALSHDTRILILDEPTAVLTPTETDELFVVIRGLAAAGCAVIFISHKLGEVLSIADTISVIRDGRIIDTLPAEGLTQADIATKMVGREVLLRVEHAPATPTEEVLAVQDLRAADGRGAIAVDGLNLSVRRGEVVGIAGVEGNGQTELAEAIAGMAPPGSVQGKILLDGHDVSASSVRSRRSRGLAYIPEDRHLEGAGPGLTVAQNIAATHLERPISRRGWLDLGAMRSFARDLIERFDVRNAKPDTIISSLSGGNMQKVIIAREFTTDPRLLMISQPTRGVDVGAMEFVHNAILTARDQGAGVLVFSADLNEVMSLSDRLLVMYRGTVFAEFDRSTMSEVSVGLAMAGVRPTQENVAEAEAEHVATLDELAAEKAEAVLATAAVVKAPEPVSDEAASPSPARATGAESFLGSARRVGKALLQPAIAVALALVVGAIVLAVIGKSPVVAYEALFFSAFQSPIGVSSFLAAFVPLLILSSSVIVSFRAGLFNLSGEGSLYIGAISGAVAGFTFTDVPSPWLPIIVLVFAAVAGALWSLLPGVLYAIWRVDLVVTTLLLSTVATLFTLYLVTGPLRDPSSMIPATVAVSPEAMLPVLAPRYGLGLDLLIAIVLVIVTGLLLDRTSWGLKLKAVGEGNQFAQYTGVSPRRMTIQIMLLSGALAGIAGALYVIGPQGGKFLQAFSPGWGFLALTVALLVRLNPWAVFVGAAFYANMMGGSNAMQITAGVPFPIVSVIQGLIIILITATFAWSWLRRSRRSSRSGTASYNPQVETEMELEGAR
ncbi:ATP-binding cassette domain-containing protein [Cryobacterium tepidiphilum]|uniref:ATP-binding cassette domain-containing protein n=1 Tax=Cryobacterium tepidiphilum TaxID=2486026 RepID=UPI0013144462|nr:ATP-binding cassette domain-containing protein [Cryobacterium tepidiphilum]